MHRRSILAALFTFTAVPARAWACGDKFLVPSRSARFRLKPSERRSITLLLFAPSGSPLDGLLTSSRLERALLEAGYTPAVLRTEDAVAAAGRPGSTLVVADLANAGIIVTKARVRPATVVVPLVAPTAKPVIEEARRRFGRVLPAPKDGRPLVDALDSLIVARAHLDGDAPRN